MTRPDPTIEHAGVVDAAAEQRRLDDLAAGYFDVDPFEPRLPGQLLTDEDFDALGGSADDGPEPVENSWIDRFDVHALPELRDQRDRLTLGGERVAVVSHWSGEVQSEIGTADARRLMIQRAEAANRRSLHGRRLAFRGLAASTLDGVVYLSGEVCSLVAEDSGPRPVPAAEQRQIARSRGEARTREDVVEDLRARLASHPGDLTTEALLLALGERL